MLTGGRNIANDYFDLSDHYNFLDADLEVSGPIVRTVLESFDAYWNSRNAVPVSRFDWREPTLADLDALREQAARYHADVQDSPYVAALRDAQQRERLLAAESPPLRVGEVRLLVDDASWLETRAPRLRLLQRRFPHALELRVASTGDPVGDDAVLLADDHAMLELKPTPAPTGDLWLHHRPHAQTRLSAFERRWEAGGHNLPVAPLGLG